MAKLVFQGASALALDAKGRFSVPARHRDALVAPAPDGAGGQLTLTKHPEGCLLVFPRPHWESFRDDLMALKGDGQWWKRIFLGNAVDVELDNASRVLISPELRAGAGLDKDVMLLGLGTHLELWDAATYAAKEAMAMRQGMPEALKSLSF